MQYEIAHGKSRDGVHYRPIRAGQQCRQSSQNQAADSGGQQFVEQRHEAGLALPYGKQRQRHHARQKNKYRRQFQNDPEPAASTRLVNAAGAKHALNIHLVDAPLKYAAIAIEKITPHNWIILGHLRSGYVHGLRDTRDQFVPSTHLVQACEHHPTAT